MKPDQPEFRAPQDADTRKTIAPVICYPPDTLPAVDLAGLSAFARAIGRYGQCDSAAT